MEYPQMREHLQKAHGLNTTKLPCTKKMRSHMDGSDWFSYNWEIEIQSGDKKIMLTNATIQPREKDDPMRDCE